MFPPNNQNNMQNGPIPTTTGAIFFNPFQFTPPRITNFNMTFRNPGTYNCMIDLNPCQHDVAEANNTVTHGRNVGRDYGRHRYRQNGSRYVSPPPDFCIETASSSESESDYYPRRSFNPRGFVGGVVPRPATSGPVTIPGFTTPEIGTGTGQVLRPGSTLASTLPRNVRSQTPGDQLGPQNRDTCGRHSS